MNARTQAAGPPAAPTARMALAVAAGAFRNTTGNATIAEIVTAATAATAAIAVGGDATEINEITGGAVGAATTDINAKPTWQPEPGSLSLAATLPGPER